MTKTQNRLRWLPRSSMFPEVAAAEARTKGPSA